MKLALILFRYFPFGGLQRDCLRIAQALVARKHDAFLITGDWEGPRPRGLDVRILERRGITNHAGDRQFAASALSLARSLDVQAIVGFNRMPGLDICYAAENCFLAKAMEERSWIYRLTPRFSAYRQLEEAVFGGASTAALLLLSERQLASYSRHYALDRSRVHLLPPAISPDRARPVDYDAQRKAVRSELGARDTDYVVLALGSASLTKGLDRTLDAVARLPEATLAGLKLWIAGRGDTVQFARLAERRGIAKAVQFLGARDDVGRLLAGADLLTHPARDECTGTVILEAVVAGLPVLCTANCGFSDHVLKARAGTVLPEPFKPADMFESLASMLDRGRLADWSRNALNYAKVADLYRGIDVAAELIEELARRTGDR